MKFISKILVLLFIFLPSTHVYAKDNALLGYWVESNGKSIAFLNKENAVFTLLGDPQEHSFVTYTKVDSKTYHVIHTGKDLQASLNVDWATGIFSINNIFSQNKKRKYLRAPNISSKDILGKWYSHTKEGEMEVSIIITQKPFSYDYESVELDHKEKTYEKVIDSDVLVSIKNGFVFMDPDLETNSEFIYYLTSYKPNELHFTDSFGNQWTQKRINRPKHIDIPEDYRPVKAKSSN